MMEVLIITVVIITETPTTEELAVEDSETQAVVTKTTKETKAAEDSETRAVLREVKILNPETKVEDLELKAAAITAAADQNLQPAEVSETALATKAVALAAVPATQADRTAAEALDKTIINKETNS